MVHRDDDLPLQPSFTTSYHDNDASRDFTEDQPLLESEPPRGVKAYGSANRSAEVTQPGVTLTWSDLSVHVPNRRRSALCCHGDRSQPPLKRVLNNVYGAVRPGSLVAVMGSSGCGKSTLLTTLAGRGAAEALVDGDVRYNGVPLSGRLRRLAGFVYQDDLFVGSLTVREHLLFTARLKMDRHTAAAERRARIAALLHELGLHAVRHTTIGVPGQQKSLSGGERKRLAFAAEILTDPPVLFCDEPTTGLDSYNAERIVSTLKQMARRGKTILCTIHQPNSSLFNMFDQLMFLSEGRLAYMGSAAHAADFFASMKLICPATYNAADFYISCLAVVPGQERQSREKIRTICDRFSVSSYAKELDVVTQYQEASALRRGRSRELEYIHLRQNISLVPWFVQMYWLTWRALVDGFRNPAVHWVRIMQKIGIGLMVGFCFSELQYGQLGVQNLQGLIFLLVTENTFPAMYGVLSLFPQELPLFLRENKNGMYSTAAFYMSRVIALVPGFALDPIVFISIVYMLTSLRSDVTSVVMMYIIAITTCNVAAACGCFFSAAFDNVSQAIALLIPFDYLLMITGGIFINLNTLPKWLTWTKSLSWFMYANEAFTIVQWAGVEGIPCAAVDNSTACLHTGEEVLNKYTFSSQDLVVDFTGFGMLFCGFHALGMAALYLKSRSK